MARPRSIGYPEGGAGGGVGACLERGSGRVCDRPYPDTELRTHELSNADALFGFEMPTPCRGGLWIGDARKAELLAALARPLRQLHFVVAWEFRWHLPLSGDVVLTLLRADERAIGIRDLQRAGRHLKATWCGPRCARRLRRLRSAGRGGLARRRGDGRGQRRERPCAGEHSDGEHDSGRRKQASKHGQPPLPSTTATPTGFHVQLMLSC